MRLLIYPLYILAIVFSYGVLPAEDHHDHDNSEHASHIAGEVEPFEHFHFSALGSPIVHSFGIETAFTGRDLIFTYRFRDAGGGTNEHEVETEVEWALTRRAGIIFEIPHIFENTSGQPRQNGFGDLVVVPRINVIERDRFFLTTQIEVTTPTGTNGFGGETAIAPGIATWCDLGNWWTVNSLLAIEHNFTTDTNTFSFGFGLVKTLGASGHLSKDEHGHPSTAGLFSILMETTGTVGLSGPDEGTLEAEGMFGVIYGIDDSCDFRVGYEFPLSTPKALNGGVIVGFIKHL